MHGFYVKVSAITQGKSSQLIWLSASYRFSNGWYWTGLQDWCRMHQAECLAVQLPGRMQRLKEMPFTSAQEAAEHLFPVVASSLAQTPYIVSTPESGSIRCSASTESCIRERALLQIKAHLPRSHRLIALFLGRLWLTASEAGLLSSSCC